MNEVREPAILYVENCSRLREWQIMKSLKQGLVWCVSRIAQRPVFMECSNLWRKLLGGEVVRDLIVKNL